MRRKSQILWGQLRSAQQNATDQANTAHPKHQIEKCRYNYLTFLETAKARTQDRFPREFSFPPVIELFATSTNIFFNATLNPLLDGEEKSQAIPKKLSSTMFSIPKAINSGLGEKMEALKTLFDKSTSSLSFSILSNHFPSLRGTGSFDQSRLTAFLQQHALIAKAVMKHSSSDTGMTSSMKLVLALTSFCRLLSIIEDERILLLLLQTLLAQLGLAPAVFYDFSKWLQPLLEIKAEAPDRFTPFLNPMDDLPVFFYFADDEKYIVSVYLLLTRFEENVKDSDGLIKTYNDLAAASDMGERALKKITGCCLPKKFKQVLKDIYQQHSRGIFAEDRAKTLFEQARNISEEAWTTAARHHQVGWSSLLKGFK